MLGMFEEQQGSKRERERESVCVVKNILEFL